MTGHDEHHDRVIVLDEMGNLADTDPSAIHARLAAASRRPNLLPLSRLGEVDPRLAAALSTDPANTPQETR